MNYKEIDDYYFDKQKVDRRRIKINHLRAARHNFPNIDIRLIVLRYIYLKKKYGVMGDNPSAEEMFNKFTNESKVQYMLFVAAISELFSAKNFVEYLAIKLPGFNTEDNNHHQNHPIGDGIEVSSYYLEDEYDHSPYMMLSTKREQMMTFSLSIHYILYNNEHILEIEYFDVTTATRYGEVVGLSDIKEPKDFSYPSIVEWVDDLYAYFYEKSVSIYKKENK